MRLYIAGPMTGLPQYNFPAFATAALELRALGHDVVSPHEVPLPCGCRGLPPQCDAEDHGWSEFLRADLIALLQHAEAVALLPGWERSRGAKLEARVGRALLGDGLVLPIDEWIAEAAA
jgi:hypothetical protein